MMKKMSINNFTEIYSKELMKQMVYNNIPSKIIKTASSFLRLSYNENKLYRSVEHEVASAIQHSNIYHVNVLGEKL